ncbi:MAG: IS200/IS605 family transposase [Nostoc sp. DedSLP03]|uniref:IS200/IS605 family transposase n=1 Tax=Nostoc sp. DedSLP03 TaxID=3075400 RepID=UPI002AD23843|nr:IS200/IS605 family transposase [Nostoc sp. DedSLP03]MDZ7967751.1 IS200/IS605 family transposase [Nostoc sp. DedSLP03]
MSLWRLYYHIVWTTKKRQPLITSDKETELYNFIINKSNSLNCRLHAIGGIEDHIHLVVSIPPTIAIAEFVKKIKGSSSHHFNHNLCPTSEKFTWQEGYGIFSLGSKQLEQAVIYVQNQKIHHLEGTVNSHLERATQS